MTESLDSQAPGTTGEDQESNGQEGTASDKVREAEAALADAREQLKYAQAQDFRGEGTAATAQAEQAVYVAEGDLQDAKAETLET